MNARTDAQSAGNTGTTPKGRATRGRLMDAAQDQLRDRGTLEIAEVAAVARVAPSVIYRYFNNKAGLVEAVVTRFYDEYDEVVFLAPLAPDASWLARETLRIEQEVAFLYDHPLGRRVASGLLHEASATRLDAERQRRHAVLAARNIRRGQRAGELPTSVNADLVGAAIIGALRSVLSTALGMRRPPARRTVVRTVTRLAEALLFPG